MLLELESSRENFTHLLSQYYMMTYNFATEVYKRYAIILQKICLL